jgi:5-methylcytosine-specific restriction endonuclease McrA
MEKACIKCGEIKPMCEFDAPKNTCKVCRRAYLRSWEKNKRDSDPEWKAKVNARQAEWRKAHPEHRERKNTARRVRRLIDPEYVKRESERKKLRNANKSAIRYAINFLLVKQQGKCAICHCSIIEKHHVDHITPLARGGENDKRNYQLLCPPCNLEKGANDPLTHMQRKGKLL